jgi:hypothetical protein
MVVVSIYGKDITVTYYCFVGWCHFRIAVLLPRSGDYVMVICALICMSTEEVE